MHGITIRIRLGKDEKGPKTYKPRKLSKRQEKKMLMERLKWILKKNGHIAGCVSLKEFLKT